MSEHHEAQRGRRKLDDPLSRVSVDDEVREELEFHVEMRTRQYVEEGMSSERARERALAGLGDLASLTETCRRLALERQRRASWRSLLSDLAADLRFAGRQLRRRAVASGATLLTLALAIGIATAGFGVVWSVLLEPLPLDGAERVVRFETREPGAAASSQIVSPLEVSAWLENGGALESLGAVYGTGVTVERAGLPERLSAVRATDGLLPTLAAEPALGRPLSSGGPEAPDEMLLSHSYWRRAFASDPSIVGRTLSVDGVATPVVGVLGPELDLVFEGVDLILPLRFDAGGWQQAASYLVAFGRRSRGVSLERARAALAVSQDRVNARRPAEDRRAVELKPLREALVGDLSRRLLLLFGATGLVLLTACANVANLQLAHGLSRRSELGVRGALGAGRGRIVRQLLTETLALDLVAALGGLGIAALLVRAFALLAPPGLEGVDRARLSLPALLFAVALALVVTVLTGLLPALRSVRVARASLAGRAPTERRSHGRSLLVAAQVALALTLLVAGGLLVRSGILEGRVDPGFRIDGVLTGAVSLPSADYPTRDATAAAFDRLLAEIESLPGIESASAASRVPFAGPSLGIAYHPVDEPDRTLGAGFRIAAPGFFETAGIRRLAGRTLRASDGAGAPLALVVNRAFAEALWPGEDPIGRRVSTDNASFRDADGEPLEMTVVGMVADTREYGLRAEARPEAFMTTHQAPAGPWSWIGRTLTLVLATDRDPEAVAPEVRRRVAEVDPALPVSDLRTVRDRLSGTLAPARFNTLLFLSFGIAALVLVCVGVYGLTAFFVARSEAEIGLRVALGATRGQTVGLMLRRGLAPVAIGALFGLGLAAATTRLLRGELFGVTPLDGGTLLAAVGLVLAVGAAATFLPARRVASVEPTRALRSD